MNYKLTIENADNFNSVLMTQNGFPIYQRIKDNIFLQVDEKYK